MKTILISAGALLAFPGAAMAAEPYVALSGGVNLASDSDNQGEFTSDVAATADFGAIPAGTSVGWTTEFDTGYEISGALGYAFDGGLRTEIQLSYTDADVSTHYDLAAGGTVIDGVDVAVLTRGTPNPANPTVGAVIADGQGSLSTLGVFANVYYDFASGSSFSPYLGAGVGYQSVDVEYMPSGVGVADDSDGVFAYQLMAGANIAISESADLFAQATYRSAFERADVALDLLPVSLGVEVDQALISAGVRFRFGA